MQVDFQLRKPNDDQHSQVYRTQRAQYRCSRARYTVRHLCWQCTLAFTGQLADDVCVCVKLWKQCANALRKMSWISFLRSGSTTGTSASQSKDHISKKPILIQTIANKAFCICTVFHYFLNNSCTYHSFSVCYQISQKSHIPWLSDMYCKHVIGKAYSSTPQLVHIDSEVSIHRAVEKVLVYSEIRGCRFHLSENWWRHITQQELWSIFETFLSHCFFEVIRGSLSTTSRSKT